ncbi:uncharacterized protein [Rutidosis leptorrhynchoides]|uniref:uncharacterized protein n=1 Tax=Rutidosis leptorrhynchoides TaxID=125765 RepID=UPI003A9A1CE5
MVADGLNALINHARSLNIYKGIELGNDHVLISHLQYADDTIFFGEWSKKNAGSPFKLLKCFEIFSGLKVNFSKSCLYGMGVQTEAINNMTTYIGCQVGSLPFTYLGLPIGQKMKNIKDWEKVIEKFHTRRYSTWNNIITSGQYIDGLQIQFSNSFVKEVSKDDTTLFWKEHWIGEQPICTKYARLFMLESRKDALVEERISIVEGNNSYTWEWHRLPSGRTMDELVFLLTDLKSFSFGNNLQDTWKWRLNGNRKFLTAALSSLIDEKLLQTDVAHTETMRNNFLPQKLSIFVWRAKQNRIPVLVELDKRGIDLDTVKCPVCDNGIETVEHIILSCSFAKDLWRRVFKWWNKNHDGSFPYLSMQAVFLGRHSSSSSTTSKLWQTIEWTCGYIIWQNRNHTIFSNKKGNGPMALNEVQIKSF